MPGDWIDGERERERGEMGREREMPGDWIDGEREREREKREREKCQVIG